MMDNSIDDMYNGCSDAMAEKVKNEYFPREMKKNELFKKAWENKEKTATKSNKTLTKEQNQALLVYTGQAPKVYEPFNAVVRDSADKYATNEFTYHALHYWLTTALQRT
ncbi:hypothetical protein NL108_018552 [Boleophthalmus pectinirostris]|nr:hypothetical protein NL108_018552 [Boleophthalmus pectinirostris]